MKNIKDSASNMLKPKKKKIMKSLKILLISWLFISSHFAIYADCRLLRIGEARSLNYETSDIIFLGIPVKVEGNSCEFIVIEEYKKKIDKKVWVVFEGYIAKEDIFSLWLIYGHTSLNNDTIYVDECSLSRSINNIRANYLQSIPPPIPENAKSKEDNIFMAQCLIRAQFRNDFYDEIEMLKELKTYDTNKDIETSKENGHNALCQYFTNILLLITIGLLLCILWKLRKNEALLVSKKKLKTE